MTARSPSHTAYSLSAAVIVGRDDDFEGASEVGDGTGEDLVGIADRAGQAGQVGRMLGEGCLDGAR
jgi:hypothetical protein